jgi:hypothetical protein
MEYSTHLGEFIRERCKEYSISLSSLAKLLDIRRQTFYSRLDSGKFWPEEIEKIIDRHGKHFFEPFPGKIYLPVSMNEPGHDEGPGYGLSRGADSVSFKLTIEIDSEKVESNPQLLKDIKSAVEEVIRKS